MESTFESGIIIQPFFWFYNVMLIFFFLFALASGYKHGARYVLSTIVKSVLQIGNAAYAVLNRLNSWWQVISNHGVRLTVKKK